MPRATPGINPASPAAVGFETPTFDKLRNRHKLFCLSFMKHGDSEQAAIAAGYSSKSAAIYGFEIGRLPDVVTALEELTARALNAAEFSKVSTIGRLRAEATVSMSDLCYENDNQKWKPLPHDKIEPQWQQCTGLIIVTREGNAQMNTTAQSKARELLAKYMQWDKQEADAAPAVLYNFSGLKD